MVRRPSPTPTWLYFFFGYQALLLAVGGLRLGWYLLTVVASLHGTRARHDPVLAWFEFSFWIAVCLGTVFVLLATLSRAEWTPGGWRTLLVLRLGLLVVYALIVHRWTSSERFVDLLLLAFLVDLGWAFWWFYGRGVDDPYEPLDETNDAELEAAERRMAERFGPRE